jgi:hypothetical protein
MHHHSIELGLFHFRNQDGPDALVLEMEVQHFLQRELANDVTIQEEECGFTGLLIRGDAELLV